MGRESAYSGMPLTWEFMTEDSTQDTFKHDLKMTDAIESRGFAVPGSYDLT